MKSRNILFLVCIMALLSFSYNAGADELDTGKQLMSSGNAQAAADILCKYAMSNPNDSKKTPEALALCGRCLDSLADYFTGAAEKRCYWGKGGGASPSCMDREAQTLNSKYGEGSFKWDTATAFMPYTGAQYKKIAEKFSNSSYASEADFYILLRELVGHPDTVLPKIKNFISKNSKGEWNRKGLLLWARVNEDIWYVHRKWSWVLYNNMLSAEESIIKAEPYRQEALKTFEKLMKDSGTFEGRAAAREYAMLKASQDDNVTYSIVNDSAPGSLSVWGVEAPRPAVISQDVRGINVGGAGDAKQPAATPTDDLAPEQPKEDKKVKKSGAPKRWE